MPTILDALLSESPEVCGGRIRIDGTRITVHRIASLYKTGRTAEEIQSTYPHLTLAQIYAALAWYHAHRPLIDAELQSDIENYEALRREPLTSRR